MGDIAVNQNSTIIVPVPIDLFRPFLESQNEASSYGQEVRAARCQEEKEAERLCEKTVGDAMREVSSEEVPTEMPDGEANRQPALTSRWRSLRLLVIASPQW